MNRKQIRLRKIQLEKNITAWGIRADKLDATIKAKQDYMSKYIEKEEEVIAANQELARLQIQLIKVNAEYDGFVKEHNKLTDQTLANRKTTRHASDSSGPVRTRADIQPT